MITPQQREELMDAVDALRDAVAEHMQALWTGQDTTAPAQARTDSYDRVLAVTSALTDGAAEAVSGE